VRLSYNKNYAESALSAAVDVCVKASVDKVHNEVHSMLVIGRSDGMFSSDLI
jgi:hypothetical protein